MKYMVLVKHTTYARWEEVGEFNGDTHDDIIRKLPIGSSPGDYLFIPYDSWRTSKVKLGLTLRKVETP